MEKQQKQKDTVEKKQQKPTETEKSVPLAVASSPPNSQTATVAPVQSTSAPTPTQVEEKKQEPAKASKPQVKKDEAVARGLNLSISKKHSMYICSFIKNKSVESAIADLEQVLKFKKAVPYKGEIPHRHGMMSGRYPINASKVFISVLKGLKGNIVVSGLAPDKARITFASASWASRPQRKGGARFKRTHVVIKAREVTMKEKPNKEKKK